MIAPVTRGTVAAELAEELPGLAVAWTTVPGAPARSRPGVRERLGLLASRIGGAQALALRQGEVPHAHRVFFRHVGLDPDVVRTPVEAAIVQRLLEGGFPVRERLADACLLAVVETGVGVWAMDGPPAGPLTLRPAGEDDRGVAADALLVADERGPVAVLFEEVRADRAPAAGTERVTLFAVQVPGVADAFVEEALWIAADAVADEDGP